MGTEPITPDDDRLKQINRLPDNILDEFNNIIIERFDGRQASFKLSTIVERIFQHTGIPKETLFSSHYLDVEALYRDVGWDVEYDQPGYNETYEATFTFRKRNETN